MDFDDLIVKTVELFKSYPEVLEYYQERFRYLMVDEYQDTNTAQFRFVSLLAGRYKNLCVVGDDDQSIYKFRGANIGNILNFEKVFPDACVVKLERNYRSTQNILDAANEVIKNNRGRKEKKLWTENDKARRYVSDAFKMVLMRPRAFRPKLRASSGTENGITRTLPYSTGRMPSRVSLKRNS